MASRPTATTHAVVDPALSVARGTVNLIVVRRAGTGDAADRGVRALGGKITLDLPIIRGFAASLPAQHVGRLAANRAVSSLTLDRKTTVQASGGTGGNLQSVFSKATRADDLNKSGITGQGVTVALVDTGVTDMPDLAGRIVSVQTDPLGTEAPCINLSGEPTCADSYGHGTFLAGLIAGNGAASGGLYKGVAPGARIVSVKVAGRDGSADVSSVIAAIQWVVSFRQQYGIRVLNLSLGTDSTQSYRVDPLNYAVERAWDSGIAVVVSASNRGPGAGTIAKPGDDPLVITVGAVDDRGTPGAGDDSLPNFSSRGPTAADGLAKPDIVAPGGHVVSLSAPGSALSEIPTSMAAPYRRGSGTSMSAAIVSGEVALLLAAHPSYTPDRVKYLLSTTARGVASSDPMQVGTGLIDIAGANAYALPGVANQGVVRSNGMGSLDLSRGTVRVMTNDPLQTVVSGEMTVQLLLWDPVAYTATEWSGASWYGASWYGASWYGASWYGASWYGASWYGASWYGEVDGASWYGASWYGASWYGAWE